MALLFDFLDADQQKTGIVDLVFKLHNQPATLEELYTVVAHSHVRIILHSMAYLPDNYLRGVQKRAKRRDSISMDDDYDDLGLEVMVDAVDYLTPCEEVKGKEE